MLGLVGGGVVGATSSDAAIGPECFGTSDAAVCVTVDPSALPTVDPTGGPGIHQCVFVGPPPCMPVDVPTPSISPGSGSPVVVQCIGAVPCPSNTDNVTTVGNGVIVPGLTITCTNQFVYFDSTFLVFAGDENSLNGRVHFDGASSGCETDTFGQGSGTLTGDMAGTVTYVRTGTIVTITGSVTVNGESHGLTAECAFSPTTYNPIDHYALACTGTMTE